MENKIKQLELKIQELETKLSDTLKLTNTYALYSAATTRIVANQDQNKFQAEIEKILKEQKEQMEKNNNEKN